MTIPAITGVTVAAVPTLSPEARAQTIGEVFRTVAPSVVVVRAKGRDVAAAGTSRFSETGSGVLISPDGRVMPAARVILQGGQEGRAWSAVIAGDTGKLSAGVLDQQAAFVLFGACAAR